LHRHTLEFGTITNSQHLNPRSFVFGPNDIERYVKGSHRKWTNSRLTKNDLRFLPCGLSRMVPTSLVRRS
jgi:hypothetical protein